MKKAFSLLELVLVMMILGILISFAGFNLRQDKLSEGARSILNDILYTRNLALMQNSFRANELSHAKREWYKSRWQLYFINSAASNYEQTYTIFLDKNGDGNANLGKLNVNLDREIAVDIVNPTKLMNSGQSGVIHKDDEKASARFNIEKRFGIEKVEFRGACSETTRIIFDEFGRLYSPLRSAKNPFDKSLAKSSSTCILRLNSKSKKQICIVIDTLSGYAYIPKFSDFNIQFVFLKNKMIECGKI
ncbi:type II secretion system protein [Campylobacter upsaliensis]|nr:type II secretion system protein [Campylobacter upsaliensis]